MDAYEKQEMRELEEDLVKLVGVSENKAKDIAFKIVSADNVESSMKIANDLLGGRGVEEIKDPSVFIDRYWRDTVLLYVNLGKKYEPTVCFDTDYNEFFVGSWGEFVDDLKKPRR